MKSGRVLYRNDNNYPEIVKSLQKTFAQRLSNAVEADGRNQADIAEAAGVSTRALQDAMYGHSWPKPDNIEAIAKALKIDPFSLFVEPAPVIEPKPDLFEGAVVLVGYEAAPLRVRQEILEKLGVDRVSLEKALSHFETILKRPAPKES